LSVLNLKNLVNGMGERLFAILKTSMRSERFLLSSRDHRFNLARRSMYESFCIPGMSLVNLHVLNAFQCIVSNNFKVGPQCNQAFLKSL